MKKSCLFLIVFIFAPIFLFAQSNKKIKPTISASTSINYYPALEAFTYSSSFANSNDGLILNFLTSNSGTFVVEDREPYIIEETIDNTSPWPIIGLGASVQIEHGKKHFQEISLTKLLFSKSSRQTTWVLPDSLEGLTIIPAGFDQRTFAFGFRYEFGKYFKKRKKAKTYFGLTGGLETSMYFYKRTPKTSREYPIKENLVTVEASVIPMLRSEISKKVSIEFKLIPNFLVGEFGSFETQNPTLTERQQTQTREYSLPHINLAFSAMVKYKIKEPKKRRG